MAKQRSLNELRQEKNYGYKPPKPKVEEYSVPEPKDDIEATKALIVNTIQDDMFDMIFQAVNEEMSKYYVFKQDNYFTEAGEDQFEEVWFEFYHKHHGDILSAIMKNFTK
tara:strand:+ start:508 stop:837 length:330 start_codon:yes stop_codon:yes gene_type:complete